MGGPGWDGNGTLVTGSMSACQEYCSGVKYFQWFGEYVDGSQSFLYSCWCQHTWATNKFRSLPGSVSGRTGMGDASWKPCIMELNTACEEDTSYFGNVVTFQENVPDLKTCQSWCASQNVPTFSYHSTYNADYPTMTQRCCCSTRLQASEYHHIVGVFTGGVHCEQLCILLHHI